MAVDTVSEKRILELHPAIRIIALDAYREAVRITPKGVHPYITEGMRSFKRSDDLYAQGRTKPGQIVTNAPGGTSYHNYGLAIDFCNQINGKLVWTVDKNWMLVVDVFKKKGFVWGGDFKTIKDAPHLQMTFGIDWRELLKRYNAKKVDCEGYVLLN